MLWILVLIGVVGAGSMLILISIEALSINCDRAYVRVFVRNFVIFFIIGIIGAIGLIGIHASFYDETSKTGEWELISLTDDNQISGIGYYVCAFINTKEMYTFYYKLGNGGYKRGSASASRTTIFEEEEDCTPRLVEYTTYTKNKLNRTLRLVLTFNNKEEYVVNDKIYVPKGTILRTIKLDSQ